LALLPYNLSRSRRLLVLAGPALPSSLLCSCQIYLWSLMGGRESEVEVEMVAASAKAREEAIAALDTFHVMHAHCDEHPAAEELLRHSVELATVNSFNVTVRDILPLVRRATARHAAEAEARGAGAERHGHHLPVAR
jgi:hypothetical protein